MNNRLRISLYLKKALQLNFSISMNVFRWGKHHYSLFHSRWASLFTGSKFPTLGLTTARSTSRAMWSTWCTLFRLKVTIWFITIILILCHLVMFAVPPRIHNLHPLNGSITVRSGSRVRLECRASGQPPPSIYWSRKVINITIWSPLPSSSSSSLGQSRPTAGKA